MSTTAAPAALDDGGGVPADGDQAPGATNKDATDPTALKPPHAGARLVSARNTAAAEKAAAVAAKDPNTLVGGRASAPKRAAASAAAARAANGGSSPTASDGDAPVRSRPTNNQLQYLARFHWEHYAHPLRPQWRAALPNATEACASVTAAFLQVLKALNDAEAHREQSARNILKILSTNTRRSKVVALSMGTHRVPEELRRHHLTDREGNEYSTNLDRNRYGSDDQYLSTVVKFDLAALGLCPRLVSVEILDAKQRGCQPQVITAPESSCTCCAGNGAAAAASSAAAAAGPTAHAANAAAAAAAATAMRPPAWPSVGAPGGCARPKPMRPTPHPHAATGGLGMLLDALKACGSTGRGGGEGGAGSESESDPSSPNGNDDATPTAEDTGVPAHRTSTPRYADVCAENRRLKEALSNAAKERVALESLNRQVAEGYCTLERSNRNLEALVGDLRTREMLTRTEAAQATAGLELARVRCVEGERQVMTLMHRLEQLAGEVVTLKAEKEEKPGADKPTDDAGAEEDTPMEADAKEEDEAAAAASTEGAAPAEAEDPAKAASADDEAQKDGKAPATDPKMEAATSVAVEITAIATQRLVAELFAAQSQVAEQVNRATIAEAAAEAARQHVHHLQVQLCSGAGAGGGTTAAEAAAALERTAAVERALEHEQRRSAAFEAHNRHLEETLATFNGGKAAAKSRGRDELDDQPSQPSSREREDELSGDKEASGSDFDHPREAKKARHGGEGRFGATTVEGVARQLSPGTPSILTAQPAAPSRSSGGTGAEGELRRPSGAESPRSRQGSDSGSAESAEQSGEPAAAAAAAPADATAAAATATAVVKRTAVVTPGCELRFTMGPNTGRTCEVLRLVEDSPSKKKTRWAVRWADGPAESREEIRKLYGKVEWEVVEQQRRQQQQQH